MSIEASTEVPLGLVSQVAQKLRNMGFVIVTARFGDNPCITVKATYATRQLESELKGKGFDGGQHYCTYAANVDGVQVEWRKAPPVAKFVVKHPLGRKHRPIINKRSARLH